MRILMLGNSFTAANDLPQRLAQLTGAGRGWRNSSIPRQNWAPERRPP